MHPYFYESNICVSLVCWKQLHATITENILLKAISMFHYKHWCRLYERVSAPYIFYIIANIFFGGVDFYCECKKKIYHEDFCLQVEVTSCCRNYIRNIRGSDLYFTGWCDIENFDILQILNITSYKIKRYKTYTSL